MYTFLAHNGTWTAAPKKGCPNMNLGNIVQVTPVRIESDGSILLSVFNDARVQFGFLRYAVFGDLAAWLRMRMGSRVWLVISEMGDIERYDSNSSNSRLSG